MPGPPANDRLDSWKEIARYLNRDARTVQRWEATRGLPVHRPVPGRLKGSPVYAFKSELEAWLAPRGGDELLASNSTAAEAAPTGPAPLELRRGRWKPIVVMLAMLALAVAGIWTLRTPPAKPTSKAPASIAILPFTANPAGDEMEVLAEGVADEIRSKLARLDGVRVVARTSSFQFKGSTLDLREIGRKLNVDSVLEGSVRRVSDGVRVTVQLSDAVTGFHLWSGADHATGDKLLRLGDWVTREVAARLAGANVPVAGTYYPSAAAYQAVLHARYHLHRRTASEVGKALAEFEQAIQLEPAYPEAHAGLGAAWFLAADYAARTEAEALPKARAAALKALSLDETLAEAHAVLASVHCAWEWDWEAAGAALRKAIALKPGDAMIHHWYANLLLALRRFEESLRERQVAEMLDPVSPVVQVAHAFTLMSMARYPEAIRKLENVLELDPHFQMAYRFLARAYAFNGNVEQGLRTEQKVYSIFGDIDTIPWDIAYLLALAGHSGKARAKLAEAVRTHGRKPLDMAPAHIALGEHATALDLIEEAINQHNVRVWCVATLPEFSPLRGNPRFQTLLQRINLR
jgi:serine/threonine-protein kinase